MLLVFLVAISSSICALWGISVSQHMGLVAKFPQHLRCSLATACQYDVEPAADQKSAPAQPAAASACAVQHVRCGPAAPDLLPEHGRPLQQHCCAAKCECHSPGSQTMASLPFNQQF